MSKATSFTPNFLHFGRELESFVTVALQNPKPEAESYGDFVRETIDRLDRASEICLHHMGLTVAESHRQYNKHVKLQ